MKKRYRILFVALSLVLWTVPAFADFTPISYPNAAYLGQTTYIDFSSLLDSNFKNGLNVAPFYSTVLTEVSDGFLTVEFSSDMYKVTTPSTNWASWSVSPNSQRQSSGDPLPILLSDNPYNPNLTSYIQNITMTFSRPVYIFGFEAEPDIYNASYLMTASFYNGSNLLGSIPRIVGDWPIDPTTGARLFAASSTDSITSIQFSIERTSTNDFKTPFALGAFRYSVPEPATMLLLGFGLIGLAGLRRKFRS